MSVLWSEINKKGYLLDNMKKWSKEKLISAGYEIKNAKVTHVDLSMEDHGVICLEMSYE